jgi:hypothetical protein
MVEISELPMLVERITNMDQQDAVRKIQRLLAIATHEATTVGEAAQAAAMAQRLIAKHNINEVLLAEKQETPEDTTVCEETVFEFDGPRIVTWTLNLSGALGDVNGCKIWYLPGFGTAKGRIVGAGRSADLAAIRYMLSYLTNEIERLCAGALRKHRKEGGIAGKTWTNSFKLGAVGEVSLRIREEMRRVREEALDPTLAYKRALECGDSQRLVELDSEPKYELAVVQQALVKIEDRRKRADEWAESKHHFRQGPSRAGAKNYGAYQAGREAGRSINLSGSKQIKG